jgi:hypothetical protein
MIDQIKKNQWVCHRNDSFGRWHATFQEEKMTSPWEVFLFMKQLYIAGEEESVYCVQRTEGKNAYSRSSGNSYIHHLEKVLHDTGEFIGFRDFSSGPRRDVDNEGFLATARLNYYDENGRTVESEVGDTGVLLMHLRPDKIRHSRNHMAAFFPLSLYGQRGGWLQDGTTYQTSLMIYIHTNIWLPKVRGFPSDPREWYDNSELALRHTPRLNRFLLRVKELTLQYGGKWELSTEHKDEIHWPMLSEDGIILD